MSKVTDERLAYLIATEQAFADGNGDIGLRQECEDVANALRELQSLRKAVADHNEESAGMCGVGEAEGVNCGYRNYFPRRCSECPKRNWTISIGPLPPETKP